MKKIRAIETQYKGYRFRSRLEARWAVFFDCLNLRWEYEAEGFELSDGRRYLPDFVVSSQINGESRPIIYEIKPPGSIGDGKLEQLLNDVEAFYGTVLSGDPLTVIKNTEKYYICPRCFNIYSDGYNYCFSCDEHTPSYEEDETGKRSPFVEYINEGKKSQYRVESYKGDLEVNEDDYEIYWDYIMRAATKARSARFEFGETP